jgi:hypothetical protein
MDGQEVKRVKKNYGISFIAMCIFLRYTFEGIGHLRERF